MKKIEISVPPGIADAFEEADKESKRKVEIYINALLTDFFSKKNANHRLFDLMRKATQEAAINGFSEEELQAMLREG